MVRELRHIEIDGAPGLEALADEVSASREPVVLRRDGRDVAVVNPAPKRRRESGRPLTPDDALFKLIGIGKGRVPGGISGRKHEHLLESHRLHHS